MNSGVILVKISPQGLITLYCTDVEQNEPVRHVIYSFGMYHFKYCEKYNSLFDTQQFRF